MSANSRNGDPERASIETCFAHTDLRSRLARVPVEAASRGAFFNMLDDRAGAFGPAVQRAYRDYFQLYRFAPFRFYPVRDYLARAAVLSNIQFGADNIYDGLRQIQKAAHTAWSSTLLGRATLAMLKPNLVEMLRAVRFAWSTRQVVNYGQFDFTVMNPNHVVVRFREEYNYIQYAMRGGLEGTADLCGLSTRMEVDLHDDLNGDIHIHVLDRAVMP